MDRSTNSNMIIFYIAMSKNTVLENLSAEFAAMPQALEAAGSSDSNCAMILARVINGVNCETWQKTKDRFALHDWHGLPTDAGAGDLEAIDAGYGKALEISPFRTDGSALTREAFMRLLKRELARQGRTGSSLTLISAALAGKQRLQSTLGDEAVKRLEGLLGAILISQLEPCDSVGLLRKNQYICCLPGIGQLVARRFAEKAKNSFTEAAKPLLAHDPAHQDDQADCALGIVNILQGESSNANDLMNRSKTSLELALAKKSGYIHQETSNSPLEGTTLVHSSEKRFLFFGSDK